MDFNRRNFLKGISLTAFAGAASPRLMAEGTTLALPEMSSGRLKPGKLQEVEHEVDLCVVGGGIGGMLTAISAARRGAKVALMHDRPVLGGNAIVPLINNILGIINIKGTKIDLRLNPIDWLQLASHGETVVSSSQAATFGTRVFVIGDSSETLIAILRYLINTINSGDNFDALSSLVGGLIGGANDSISDVVTQVLGMLQGDTDEVISSLVDLLQTLA